MRTRRHARGSTGRHVRVQSSNCPRGAETTAPDSPRPDRAHSTDAGWNLADPPGSVGFSSRGPTRSGSPSGGCRVGGGTGGTVILFDQAQCGT
jgi:hypothetical protein